MNKHFRCVCVFIDGYVCMCWNLLVMAKNALSMPNYNYKHSNQTDVPFRSQFITNIHVYIHTYIHIVACTHTYMDVHTSRDTYFVYYLHPQKKPILKVSSKETPNAARQQITNKQTNKQKKKSTSIAPNDVEKPQAITLQN